jgi:hypothetical protein
MICRNGSSVAARGFFELFYRWSRVGCSGAGQRRGEALPLIFSL